MAGLATEYGRDPGSARRGEAFSAAENETTRGEDCDCPGAGFRLVVLLAGDETGMFETWLRKAEKEGTAMCASEVCLRTPWDDCSDCNGSRDAEPVRRGGGLAEELE